MNSRNPVLPLPAAAALLLLAATSGGLAATLFTPDRAAPSGPVPDDPRATSVAVHDLSHRLAALEQQLAAPVAERADGDAVVHRTAVDDDLRRRIERLEQQLDALVRNRAKPAAALPDARQPEVPEDRLQAQQRERQFHRTALLDPAATEEARLVAWRALRSIPDSYDDEVVATMTRLGLSSADAATRADVWRQADSRSTHPAMATALLQALQTDAAANVREEAAETLENYLEVAGVRQALEIAAQSDADEKVRRQANATRNATKR